MTPFMEPSLPDRKRLDDYLDGIYERRWLTNNGPLLQELTVRLEEYLGVKNLLLLSSGTAALQVAYRALQIDENVQDGPAEVITTPFTFVATESSLKWQGLRPVFADICPDTLNLCPQKTAALINDRTRAIVPVHVFGNPCEVSAFAELSAKSDLKLVYDAAHAFGVRIGGQSVLNFGDAAILSFHATKVFNTVEGGGIVFKDTDAYESACEIINFGRGAQTAKINRVGINAKMSEVHAAFGLALLHDIDAILEQRIELLSIYENGLPTTLRRPLWDESVSQNAAYMPVLFGSVRERQECEQALGRASIPTRRYFSPCLGDDQVIGDLKVARSAAERILCLPLHAGMNTKEAQRAVAAVSTIIK